MSGESIDAEGSSSECLVPLKRSYKGDCRLLDEDYELMLAGLRTTDDESFWVVYLDEN